MMTAFKVTILVTVIISAMGCLAAKIDERKSYQITLGVSGALLLLSEVVKCIFT